MRLNLKIWRQAGPGSKGRLEDYTADNVSPDMSFLEMLDVVNEGLVVKGKDAIAFDSDCREGICGMCSLVVNGIPHGPDRGTTVCQLHMRRFKDGETVTIEPWRAKAFPVVKDLVVDRSAFDRIIASGGYVSVNAGGAQDGNSILIPKEVSEAAMDSAACIACGACVAACKNASAHLFMSAKISHLALLPQGQQERYTRVVSMINQADSEGFGSCSNEGECEAVCPKEIPIANIARMTREYINAHAGGGEQGRSGWALDPPDRGVEAEVGDELQLAAGRVVRRAQPLHAPAELLVRQHRQLRREAAIDNAVGERRGGGMNDLDAVRLHRFGPGKAGQRHLAAQRPHPGEAFAIDRPRLREIVVDPPVVVLGVRVLADGQQPAAGLEDAPRFGKKRSAIAEVMQGVDAEQAIERGIGERQTLRTRANETRGRHFLPRTKHHPGRGIDPHQRPACLCRGIDPHQGPACLAEARS